MSPRVLPLVAALGLAACEAEAPAPSPVGSSSQPVAAARSVELAEPVWPASLDREVRDRLPAAARAEIAKSPVPVLAPPTAAFASNAMVSVGPVWAAVSATADGVTLTLHGSKLAYKYPDVAPVAGDRTLRGKPGFVTVESNIWQASWSEGGVAYSLHAECAAAGDGRCADDKFLIASVESLAYVGGRGGAP
ncbi:MAG: hypothetical protein HS104_01145 [Polyangiaceae bacterium]|nr:hypothetical protein [Polyangiaceae bacterium]MCE7890231.1 hypothetical protein [Sorangiineae bacterium PRO1]MCL4752708.1 hypothetical protein [Myxococcales bacterium]